MVKKMKDEEIFKYFIVLGGMKMIVVSSGQLSNTSNRPVMMSIPNQVDFIIMFQVINLILLGCSHCTVYSK